MNQCFSVWLHVYVAMSLLWPDNNKYLTEKWTEFFKCSAFLTVSLGHWSFLLNTVIRRISPLGKRRFPVEISPSNMRRDFLLNEMKAELDWGVVTPAGSRQGILTSPIKPETPCGAAESGFTVHLGPNLSLQVSDFMVEGMWGFITWAERLTPRCSPECYCFLQTERCENHELLLP